MGARRTQAAEVEVKRQPCDVLQPLFEESLKSFPEDGPQRHVDEMPVCQEGKGGAYAAEVTYWGEIDGATT
jgi:hypothetical protein